MSDTVGPSIKKDITAADTWTSAFQVNSRQQGFSASIFGTFAATVSLQRRLIGETDWSTYPITWDEEDWVIIDTYGAWEYRMGVKTGDYVSGTVKIHISRAN